MGAKVSVPKMSNKRKILQKVRDLRLNMSILSLLDFTRLTCDYSKEKKFMSKELNAKEVKNMSKITVQELRTIFQKAAEVAKDLIFGDLLAHLEGNSTDNIAIVQMLKGENLRNLLDQTTRTLLKVTSDQFKTTAIFTIKLSLLLAGLNSPQQRFETYPNIGILLQQLLDLAPEILKKNDLPVQLYLLDLLQQLKSQQYVEKNLSEKIGKDLKTLIELCNHTLPNNAVHGDHVAAMEKLFRIGYVISDSEVFSRNFLNNCKSYLQNKEQYSDRHIILRGILSSWQIMKNTLTVDDLNWVREQVQSLAQQYQKTNFRIRYTNKEMYNFFVKGFIRERFTLLALSPIFILMLWQSNFFSSVLSSYRAAALNFLKSYHELILSKQGTLEQLNEIKKQVDYIIKYFELPTDIVQAIAELEWRGWLSKILIPLFLLAVAATSYGTIFFTAPVESRPITLPEWVNEQLVTLQSPRPD